METRFWSRVGHWFRRSSTPTAYSDDRASDVIGSGTGADSDALRGTRTVMTDDGSGAVTKFRLPRSGGGLQRLEEEYARVVGLMDAIQTHLAAQAGQTEKMADALDRLAQSLAHAPETSQKQLELLSTISETVAADAACTKRMEEGLAQLPQIADAQRETMVSIDRQLDLSRQATERVGTSMDQMHQAVHTLGEATEGSTKVIEGMRFDAAAGNERLTALLQKQTKRLTIFAWSALGVAVVAAATAVIALLR